MVDVVGTLASVRMVPLSRSRSTIRSIRRKYSRRMQPRLRRRGLGGDQLVDARAEILQHEILLGRRLAVVDFLGPLLERQLDAESLVDGECDIEKVEAVDAQIVDGVAFRLDLVALDIAGLGNDVRHGVESRRHRQPSEMCLFSAAALESRKYPRPGTWLPPARLIPCRPYSQGVGRVQWRPECLRRVATAILRRAAMKGGRPASKREVLMTWCSGQPCPGGCTSLCRRSACRYDLKDIVTGHIRSTSK